MRNYEAKAEFRLLDPADDQKIDDKFLICKKVVYLTPPWNVIHKKLGAVVPVKNAKNAFKIRGVSRKQWSRAKKIS